jgi:DNA (cytosine-5)-methyltransferase 1
MVYEARFGGKNHCNEDIATVSVRDIPDHDLLVGGFPCQDYSVATTLRNSKGLIGKKGVLWWSIHKILSEKRKKPHYLFLENVDRLLISPSGQRGRDFAIILKSLAELGYVVEWRVVNAADYGMPQRRRRVFILAYLEGSAVHEELCAVSPNDWILEEGTFASAFPVTAGIELFPNEFEIKGDIVEVSNNFNKSGSGGFFENSGIMVNGLVTTARTFAAHDGGRTFLGDIIQSDDVPADFYIDSKDLDRWAYLKGPKKEMRRNVDGFEYHYSEGGMVFPDPLDKPSRTIITGEGGKSPSRFKHVIITPDGYRRLTPVELERLNMFPDNHTRLTGISEAKRAFFMGNALVVGVVEKIGIALKQKIKDESAVQSQG